MDNNYNSDYVNGFKSGSMYEEIEAKRNAKLHKRKILKRRGIAIVILVLIVAYLGILLNDIRRFHQGLYPWITIGKSTKTYDDGKVDTYTSLGWVFRYYMRETINTSEIAPIWSSIRMDNILNRNVNDPNLPEVEKDYKIPDNISKRAKVDGVLFFYDKEENLLGTYKCLLSESDCEISISDVLSNDTDKSNVEMGYIENRYVFITEYKNKSTEAEEKRVFLYDINAKHLIAEYQGVRYTTTLENDNGTKTGLIDNSKYMVKKNDLWGIDEVIKGQVTNFEDYQYKYIAYDKETGLYIMQKKKDEFDDVWIAMDANNKVYTAPISETIESLYFKNDKIYVIAYTLDTSKYKKNYLLYNQDGENVLEKKGIDDLRAYDKFVTYTNDQKLYLIDYDGSEIISAIPIYIEGTYSKVKPYTISFENNNKTLKISIPKDTNKTHAVEIHYYNTDDWSKIRTINARETID